MAAKDRCRALYYSALRADHGYERAIHKVFGPRATRWTISTAKQDAAPLVRARFKRKVALDTALHRACGVMRARGESLNGTRRRR